MKVCVEKMSSFALPPALKLTEAASKTDWNHEAAHRLIM
jgi:hypothetical protein